MQNILHSISVIIILTLNLFLTPYFLSHITPKINNPLNATTPPKNIDLIDYFIFPRHFAIKVIGKARKIKPKLGLYLLSLNDLGHKHQEDMKI